MRSIRAVLLIIAIAAAVIYAADQLSKLWVINTLPPGVPVTVWGNFLVFEYVKNPGAAFSFASGATWIFSLIATAVVIFIVVNARKIRSVWWAVVFGLLLGGTLGNLTDRLLREPSFGQGHVIDFISMPWMLPAIYNVADAAIVVSMVLLCILVLLGINMNGTRTKGDGTALKAMNYGANPTVSGGPGVGPGVGPGAGGASFGGPGAGSNGV